MPPYLVPLDTSDLPSLLGADASLYPSPLTLSTLSSWVSTAPYLSLKYVSSPSLSLPCGVCIVLPLLSQHWQSLIRGGLKEWDIAPEHLWSPPSSATGEKVGFHFWHIERFETWEPIWGKHGGFSVYCLKDVEKAVDSMIRKGCPGVIGYSALCVTPAGERLFGEKLSYIESRYYSGQVVVKDLSSGETSIIEREIWERMPPSGEVIANCKMLVKFS